MSFKLSIITPAGSVFDGDVDSLYAPGLLGGFEVYSGHAAMMTALKQGQARVKQQGKTFLYAIDSGILEVTPQHNVLLLADQATAV
jgi:F-type H+-transporting ATPase subunit epsilon